MYRTSAIFHNWIYYNQQVDDKWEENLTQWLLRLDVVNTQVYMLFITFAIVYYAYQRMSKTWVYPFNLSRQFCYIFFCRNLNDCLGTDDMMNTILYISPAAHVLNKIQIFFPLVSMYHFVKKENFACNSGMNTIHSGSM